MCPSKAIIFPKYEKSPVNGGLDEEEHFAPEEMDAMYRERLKMRLAQRKAGVSLLKNQYRMTYKEYIRTAKTSLRVARESSPRLIWKFIYNFGWQSVMNMNRFEKRQKEGKPFFPAFVMISVTETCNLACSGCWVSKGGKQSLSMQQLEGVIESGKKKGSYFFGILGGEPLMY